MLENEGDPHWGEEFDTGIIKNEAPEQPSRQGDMRSSDWAAVRGLKWNATQMRIIDMLQADDCGVPVASFKQFTSSIRVMISIINSKLREQSLPYQISPTKPFKDRKNPIEYRMFRFGSENEF